MKRLTQAVRAGMLLMGSLGLLLGAGCHDSSEGASPAASASVATAASTPPPADPTTASAPDPTATGDTYEDTDPSAVTDFHPVLDSHGSWVEDPKYGTIWVPSTAVVGADFVPYRTGGHWAYGDDYVWVSDYDWGWAPFHYGRWAFLDNGGWGWIPGRVYAPAWVTWRTGAPGFGFVGWAPLAPTWGWRAGAVVTFGFPVVPRFSYCANVDLFNHGLATRVLVGARVAQAEVGTKVWVGESVHAGHVSGPAPVRIGISADAVVHAPANDPAVAHAQAFSKPSTVAALGGHPPSRPAAPVATVNAQVEVHGADGIKAADTPAAKAPTTPAGGAAAHVTPAVEPHGGGSKPSSGKKEK